MARALLVGAERPGAGSRSPDVKMGEVLGGHRAGALTLHVHGHPATTAGPVDTKSAGADRCPPLPPPQGVLASGRSARSPTPVAGWGEQSPRGGAQAVVCGAARRQLAVLGAAAPGFPQASFSSSSPPHPDSSESPSHPAGRAEPGPSSPRHPKRWDRETGARQRLELHLLGTEARGPCPWSG